MKKPKVIGYLRVSTADQDTEKNKSDILQFTNEKKWGNHVEFVEEKVSGTKSWKNRKLAKVAESMKAGDKLIVPELSRLGRSLKDVLDILELLSDKDVAVYSVKEAFQLNGKDTTSKIMRTMISLFAEIERDLISARTKEGLAAARKSGKLLGRPKGPGKSKLDPYKEEIQALLKNGSKKSFIAERYGVTNMTLWNWISKHGIDDTAEPGNGRKT